MITAVLILTIAVLVENTILAVYVVRLHTHKDKDSEFFTDYRFKNLVLRVYKPEFEFQATSNVKGEILDRGRLSLYYDWTLIKL